MLAEKKEKRPRIINCSKIPEDALVDTEAAEYLAMDLDEFYRWFDIGEIPGLRIGDRLFFSESTLYHLINSGRCGFEPF